MPAPPPPPPPPGPPPPPAFSQSAAPKQGNGNPGDRSELLASIRLGTKLKKAVTVDKSAPLISGKSSAASNPPAQNSGPSPVPNGGGPMGLGALFAGGMPKLRPAGQRQAGGGSPLKPQSKPVTAKPSPSTSPSVPSAPKPRLASPPTNKVPAKPSTNSQNTNNKIRTFPSDVTNRSVPPPPPSNQKPAFNIGMSNTTDSLPTNASSSQNKLGPPLASKPAGVTRAASAAGAIGKNQMRPVVRPAPGVKPPPPPKLPAMNGSATLPSKGPANRRPGSYTENEVNVQTRSAVPPPPPRNITAPDNLNQWNRTAPPPPRSVTNAPTRMNAPAPPPPPPSHNKPNFLPHNAKPPSVRPPPPPVRAPASAPMSAPPPPPPHRGQNPVSFPPPPPSQTLNRNFVDQQSPAPPPPPARNSSNRSSGIKDFESKFVSKFHSIDLLPPPLPNFKPSVKSYPSSNDQNRRQQRQPPPPPPPGAGMTKVPVA